MAQLGRVFFQESYFENGLGKKTVSSGERVNEASVQCLDERDKDIYERAYALGYRHGFVAGANRPQPIAVGVKALLETRIKAGTR